MESRGFKWVILQWRFRMIGHGKEPCDEEGPPWKARDGDIDLEEICLVAMIDIEANQHKTRTRCF